MLQQHRRHHRRALPTSYRIIVTPHSCLINNSSICSPLISLKKGRAVGRRCCWALVLLYFQFSVCAELDCTNMTCVCTTRHCLKKICMCLFPRFPSICTENIKVFDFSVLRKVVFLIHFGLEREQPLIFFTTTSFLIKKRWAFLMTWNPDPWVQNLWGKYQSLQGFKGHYVNLYNQRWLIFSSNLRFYSCSFQENQPPTSFPIVPLYFQFRDIHLGISVAIVTRPVFPA